MYGGIIGKHECENMQVTKCGNDKDIEGTDYVGGITGYEYIGEIIITDCYNIKTIKSISKYSGGILGAKTNYSNIYINNSYNKGKVISSQYAGGITGYVTKGSHEGKATITNTYNVGIVEGNSSKGGIIGFNKSNTECTFLNCYYLDECDKEIGNLESSEATSMSVSEMKNIAFTNQMNANIENIENTGNWNRWKQGEDGYPELE